MGNATRLLPALVLFALGACAAGRAHAAPRGDAPAAGQTVQFGVPFMPGDREDPSQSSEPIGVLPRAPREVQRRLLLGERAARDGRYNDAVGALQPLLEEDAEDGFLSPRSGRATAATVRQEACRLLGEMPVQGREWYEVRFGGRARGLLEEAAQRGDLEALARVSRVYLHTRAGYEATLLLARARLDQGRPLESLHWLSRLLRSPAALDRCEPECSFLAAVCWLMEGNPAAARVSIAQLGRRAPGARVRIGLRELLVAGEGEELFRVLSGLCGPGAAGDPPAGSWLTFRGDAARSARSDWGGTLGESCWRVPAAEGPADVDLLRMSASAWPSLGMPPLPALHSIVVGNTVLARMPQRMVAIEAETGRRLWEFPWDSPRGEQPRRAVSARNLSGRAQDLEQRTWHEALYGQPVSDGRRVYLLDRPDAGAGRSVRQVLAGGRQVVLRVGGLPGTAVEPANRLVALNLSREGAMVWAIGPPSGEEEPKLADTFFLGAPVVDGPRLYVLAERKQEIALCVLDSASGRMEWMQTLAHPAENVYATAARRQVGATPSLAGGVLVCPTSAGALVAVDPATRSLLWGYAYPRSETLGPRSARWPGRVVPTVGPSRSMWPDAPAVIAEARVLTTPADSDLMYCLDLFTGEELWSCRREGAVFVACVHGGKAILVGPREVAAIRLADCSPGWTPQKLPIPAEALPSGRGLHCGRFYYLPTTANELLKIDLEVGRIEAVVKTPAVLGNLIGLGNRLFSQSAEAVELLEAASRRGGR